MSRLFAIIALFLLGIFFANCDLDLKSVQEGNCKNLDDHLAKNVNISNYLVKQTWYIPLGAEFVYRYYAEMFLGRPVKDDKELSKLCIRIITQAEGTEFKVQSIGYKNVTLYQTCKQAPVKGKYTMTEFRDTCIATNTSQGAKPSMFDNYQNDIVLTDGKTFTVCVLCLNGIHTWKVLTLVPELPKETISEIKKKITELGFDPKFMHAPAPCQS